MEPAQLEATNLIITTIKTQITRMQVKIKDWKTPRTKSRMSVPALRVFRGRRLSVRVLGRHLETSPSLFHSSRHAVLIRRASPCCADMRPCYMLRWYKILAILHWCDTLCHADMTDLAVLHNTSFSAAMIWHLTRHPFCYLLHAYVEIIDFSSLRFVFTFNLLGPCFFLFSLFCLPLPYCVSACLSIYLFVSLHTLPYIHLFVDLTIYVSHLTQGMF